MPVASARAAERVTLVIGNGAYDSAPLKHPVNDARDIRATLKKLAFEVLTTIAGSKREMISAIDSFADKLRRAELVAGDDLRVSVRLEPEHQAPATVTTQPATLLPSPGGGSFTDPTTGMEFVLVPGGCFQMGDTFGDGDGYEMPVHEVCVDDFYMGKYEVTQGEYTRIIGSNPSHFKKGDRYPVEQVSWDDAQDFIKKLNSHSGKHYRLPTEAEWEYAARNGGKKVRFGTGKDTIGPDEANFNASSKYAKPYSRPGTYREQTVAVGSFAPNGLGLYDISGNVWEWCHDWFDIDYYDKSPKMNPTGPSSGSYRVLRGGSWFISPRHVRAASRLRLMPDYAHSYLGFRLVLPVQ